MKQPWPAPQQYVDVKVEARPRLSKTMDHRTRRKHHDGENADLIGDLESMAHPNESTFVVRDRFGPQPTTVRSNDDRPITPMRVTYTQIADKFNKDVGLPTDPTLTNQYYENFNDFEQDDDQSPTREKREREFNEQIIRSFNGHEGSPKNERPLSASRGSTMNSMSRTIDPRQAGNRAHQSRYLASSRTLVNTRKTTMKMHDGRTIGQY